MPKLQKGYCKMVVVCYSLNFSTYLSVTGTVTMWAPSMKDPLVKMLCHRGPVRAIAVDNKGL